MERRLLRGDGSVPQNKLAGWVLLVLGLVALAYAANLSAPGGPRRDTLYEFSTAIGSAAQYGLMLAIVLAIARGIAPGTVGFRRPESWRRAAGLVLASLAAIWAIGAILNVFLKAGEEQGFVPDVWDSSRAGAFAANFAVIVIVAPIVEETTYRGLGFAAVRSAWGPLAAIVVTGLAFIFAEVSEGRRRERLDDIRRA